MKTYLLFWAFLLRAAQTHVVLLLEVLLFQPEFRSPQDQPLLQQAVTRVSAAGWKVARGPKAPLAIAQKDVERTLVTQDSEVLMIILIQILESQGSELIAGAERGQLEKVATPQALYHAYLAARVVEGVHIRIPVFVDVGQGCFLIFDN